jgi:hypothetical protein
MKTSAVLLLSLLAFSAAVLAGDPEERRDVSLVQLIVNPQVFEGRWVTVNGYLTDAGGLTFLALTREASLSGDVISGIPVSRARTSSQGAVSCLGGYVTLTGKFEKLWGEILGLVEIERAVIWDLEQRRSRECTYP